MFRIFIIVLLFASHPVHVTLLSIEYSAEEEAFNGFLKVYYDDFLLDYSHVLGKTMETEIIPDHETTRELIENYLSHQLHFFAGKKELKTEIMKISLSENELKMNLKYDMKGKSKEFRVTNNILSDIYLDQSNLLIFRCGKFEEGVKLTPEKREHVFKVK